MIEVVAVLIWDKDKFLICQRPANKARALLWEFVGGKVEQGETKEQALIRECKEELNGEFDELAASAVRRLKSEWSAFCSLTLVLPYEIANLDLIEKSYDEVIMPNDYKCHYKAAIEKRNRWLAENCDLMIGYIKRESGGAYKCFSYASERGVLLINIAEQIEPRDRL